MQLFYNTLWKRIDDATNDSKYCAVLFAWFKCCTCRWVCSTWHPGTLPTHSNLKDTRALPALHQGILVLPVSAVSDVTGQAVTLLQWLSTSGMAGACHAYRMVALASSVSRTFIACTIFSCIISHVTKRKEKKRQLLASKGHLFQCYIRIESYSRNIVFLYNEH